MLRISTIAAKWQQLISNAKHFRFVSRANSLGAIALQPRCILCRLPIRPPEPVDSQSYCLCPDCYAQLPFVSQACECCGLPLAGTVQDSVCGQCQQEKSPIHRTVSLGWYQSSIRNLVHQFKYQHNQVAGAALTQAWLSFCKPEHLPQVLIPVPSHSSKLTIRGFNPASVIAYDLASAIELPVDESCCIRLLAGDKQAGTDRAQRFSQVKGMYQVKACDYQHITIVDDVVTTQATVLEIAKGFQRVGVKRIDVWCIARTP